jgi:hypothetical protein
MAAMAVAFMGAKRRQKYRWRRDPSEKALETSISTHYLAFRDRSFLTRDEVANISATTSPQRTSSAPRRQGRPSIRPIIIEFFEEKFPVDRYPKGIPETYKHLVFQIEIKEWGERRSFPGLNNVDPKTLGRARAEFNLRRQSLTEARKVGTVASRNRAWRESELGKIVDADNLVEKRLNGFRKSIQKKLDDPDDAVRKEAQAKLDAERKRITADVYNQRGIDPDAAAKAKIRGSHFTKADGTPDWDKIKEYAHRVRDYDRFHNEVKAGDFYINPSDGRLYRRTSEAPPPADAPTPLGPSFSNPPK